MTIDAVSLDVMKMSRAQRNANNLNRFRATMRDCNRSTQNSS
jgi:hypothetical protein